MVKKLYIYLVVFVFICLSFISCSKSNNNLDNKNNKNNDNIYVKETKVGDITFYEEKIKDDDKDVDITLLLEKINTLEDFEKNIDSLILKNLSSDIKFEDVLDEGVVLSSDTVSFLSNLELEIMLANMKDMPKGARYEVSKDYIRGIFEKGYISEEEYIIDYRIKDKRLTFKGRLDDILLNDITPTIKFKYHFTYEENEDYSDLDFRVKDLLFSSYEGPYKIEKEELERKRRDLQEFEFNILNILSTIDMYAVYNSGSYKNVTGSDKAVLSSDTASNQSDLELEMLLSSIKNIPEGAVYEVDKDCIKATFKKGYVSKDTDYVVKYDYNKNECFFYGLLQSGLKNKLIESIR